MPETGQDPPDVTRSQAKTLTRGHSCLVCTRRKVKCDGQRPCSACAKSDVPCVSKPSQPRLAKVGKQRGDTSEKLKRAEALLLRHGLNIDNDPPSNAEIFHEVSQTRKQSVPQISDSGRLFVDRGHSRYVENNLWDGLSHELPETLNHSTESTYRSSGATPTPLSLDPEGLVFGNTTSGGLSSFHPSPARIFWLWQKYLDNVNPLVKVVYVPTTQQTILEASTDLTTIPADVEALMFAIYSAALASLSDQECQKTMDEPVDSLIERFTGLTQQALTNAGFLRSFSFTTLQAFVTFVVSMRAKFDPQTLWMMSGLAVRSAQRLGMHREKALQGSSVFEAEMRRRLWWQIIMLESTSSRLAGVASHAGPDFPWDTKRPLNINDGDLHPSMKELPKSVIGVTEMIFCSTRYEVGAFINAQGNRDYSHTSIEEIDAEIEQLKKGLQDRLLDFCDAAIPLHFLALGLAQSATCRMKLTARCSRITPESGNKMSRDERRMLFRLSMELIDQYTTTLQNQSIQNYLWQVNLFFPVQALIFILSDLAYQSQGLGFTESQMKTTWESMEKAYELQPRWLSDDTNAMYVALGILATKAWEKTWEKTQVPTSAPPVPPRFIKILHVKRSSRLDQGGAFEGSQGFSVEQDVGYDIDAVNLGLLAADVTFPEDPAIWLYWEELFAGTNGSSSG